MEYRELDEDIFTVSGFLSPKRCADLIALAAWDVPIFTQAAVRL